MSWRDEPEFEFTSVVPSASSRSYLDVQHAEMLIDACIENAGQWARVPIDYLYPDLEGDDEKRRLLRTKNCARRINAGEQPIFCDYMAVAKARDTTLYVQILVSPEAIREAEE